MKLVTSDIWYNINNLAGRTKALDVLEKKFTGFSEWYKYLAKVYEAVHEPRDLDEKKTEKAQREATDAVKQYIEAIEKYDETVESVANVKEYIDVMKDVAEISAIAQGSQKNV